MFELVWHRYNDKYLHEARDVFSSSNGTIGSNAIVMAGLLRLSEQRLLVAVHNGL